MASPNTSEGRCCCRYPAQTGKQNVQHPLAATATAARDELCQWHPQKHRPTIDCLVTTQWQCNDPCTATAPAATPALCTGTHTVPHTQHYLPPPTDGRPRPSPCCEALSSGPRPTSDCAASSSSLTGRPSAPAQGVNQPQVVRLHQQRLVQPGKAGDLRAVQQPCTPSASTRHRRPHSLMCITATTMPHHRSVNDL